MASSLEWNFISEMPDVDRILRFLGSKWIVQELVENEATRYRFFRKGFFTDDFTDYYGSSFNQTKYFLQFHLSDSFRIDSRNNIYGTI